MPLTHQLRDYIHAAFTGLWVQTHEPDEAEREITLQAQDANWRLAVWDIAHGLRIPGTTIEPGSNDPLSALKALPALATSVPARPASPCNSNRGKSGS